MKKNKISYFLFLFVIFILTQNIFALNEKTEASVQKFLQSKSEIIQHYSEVLGDCNQLVADYKDLDAYNRTRRFEGLTKKLMKLNPYQQKQIYFQLFLLKDMVSSHIKWRDKNYKDEYVEVRITGARIVHGDELRKMYTRERMLRMGTSIVKQIKLNINLYKGIAEKSILATGPISQLSSLTDRKKTIETMSHDYTTYVDNQLGLLTEYISDSRDSEALQKINYFMDILEKRGWL